ncbi:MAG: DNA cytosine methyltransferase [Nitrospinaceae bacterium]
MQQNIFDHHELVIDSFAGGGGASTGMEMALGRPVDVAINHDGKALAMHMVNHPVTEHFCENIWDLEPRTVTRGKPVGLAWFSPDCKHFSNAKGGIPVEKKIRGLAWNVLKWMSHVKPRVVILENVGEFQTWGPLKWNRAKKGYYPDPDRKAETFKLWMGHIKSLGYRLEYRELRASDYGAPTIRKRLFVIARRDGMPIVWPEPTHGPGLIPFRTAAEIIDWSLPCPSIFERKKPLVPATMQRIARGIQKFVINAEEPFIFTLDHQSSGNAVGSTLDPLSTITSKARHCLVTPFISRNFGQGTGHSILEPTRTVTSDGGGKSALVSAFIVKHFGGMTGVEANAPFPTITTSGTQNQIVIAHMSRQYSKSIGHDINEPLGTTSEKNKTALVSSHLIKMRGTSRHGQPITEPLHTVTGSGNHFGEVRAFLMKYHTTGGQWQALTDPLHTIPTRDRFAMVIVHGIPYRIIDIGMRMLTPRELFKAQGFPPGYAIDFEYKGKPFTKTSQIRMCGNSVCPPIAAAIVAANYVEQEGDLRMVAG